jgi:RsmE family RNA methyltransferase
VNLLLLEPHELGPDGLARLSLDDRRARHVREVLGAGSGERLRVGVVGGLTGDAEIRPPEGGALVLAPRLDVPPPPPAPLELLLGMPRPKILRRVLQAAASLGVKRIVLCGSFRVEKSYFGSPLLEPAALREQLLLGLEQGRDTVLPEVFVRRMFKPFVEDELPVLLPAPQRLLAHPVGAGPLPDVAPREPVALAIGPEGGFTAYEAGLLVEHGFRAFSLGARILRVDTAVAYAAGRVLEWIGV